MKQDGGFLVLSRAVGQGITIIDNRTGESIQIFLNDVKFNSVGRLAFQAPRHYSIVRNEILSDRQIDYIEQKKGRRY